MAPSKDYITVETLKQVLNDTLDAKLDEKLQFIKEMNNDQKILKEKVSELENKINALENYSRRNNIVVQGIPYHENEIALEVAISARELVGVRLDSKDTDIAHRLRSKNSKLPPLFVIKLVNRYKKIEMITGAKKLKPTAEKIGGGSTTKVHYNDHLSPESTHFHCRQRY